MLHTGLAIEQAPTELGARRGRDTRMGLALGEPWSGPVKKGRGQALPRQQARGDLSRPEVF